MPNYILKFKNKYRILPEIDRSTNDFVRDQDGNIVDDDIYITCAYDSKITTYGHMKDNKKTVWLTAYIPSIGRGRNIKKALDEKGIEYVDYIETSIESEFKFKAKDIDEVATLMKARTSGTGISVFSTKNLPKSNVQIPTEEIERYKAITSVVQKEDYLLIHRATEAFMVNILNKKLRKTEGKSFDYTKDMRKLMMSRMSKEYIYTKNFWNEYLEYLKKEINKFYKDKNK